MWQFKEPTTRDVDIIVWSVSMVIRAVTVPIENNLKSKQNYSYLEMSKETVNSVSK